MKLSLVCLTKVNVVFKEFKHIWT